MNNHPPHLIDRSGSISPSAFIPFCAYSSNMDSMGQLIDGLEFPICTKLLPRVLEGHLCYTVNISSLVTKYDTKSGKEHGMSLLLDFNDDRNVQVEEQSNTVSSNEKSSPFNVEKGSKNYPKIYISTLGKFSDYRAGHYGMYFLKKITGTTNFLEEPDRWPDR